MSNLCKEGPRPAILKEDRIGFSKTAAQHVTIPKGTIVDLKGFISIAYSGDVMLHYDPFKRAELFEPLDPDDEF